jgi:REP element-mobilizing transposase RayT
MVSLTNDLEIKGFSFMHERRRNRKAGFDYCSARYYFITICVKNHDHSFGVIENKLIHLSLNGIIAMEQWNWLGNQYPYIDLISFVIMPDHVHGIIFINNNYYNCMLVTVRDHFLLIQNFSR